jgi:hypothetical protein
MATMYEGFCGISLTVHSRAILKIVNVLWCKKIKCTLMICHTNVNSTPPTQLPHTFSYVVAILVHSHFESPNMCISISMKNTKLSTKNGRIFKKVLSFKSQICMF